MQSRLFLSCLIPLSFILATCTLMACVPVEPSLSDSKNAEYHYTLGVASLNEQNPTEALKEFLEAEKYDARAPKIQAGMAQAYWIKQAHGLAEEHFLRAIELSEDDPKYYNNLAALYLSMERYDDAIIAFRTAADDLLFDRPELAWEGIGLANFQKQDYSAAERSYRKSMEINPNYYMTPFRLGELYYNQDRPVEALDMFILSVSLAPNFARGHYWQGLVYMKMKETEEAKQAFLEVVRLVPHTETARLAGNYLKIINK